MADAYARIERLIVESKVAPLGMVNADNDLQNSAGFATCSMTFIVQNQKSCYENEIGSEKWKDINFKEV